MATEAEDGDQPIAWRGVIPDTPVRTSDGETVGTLSDMLGSDQADIFHGIVVHLGRLGHHVFVPADQVSVMTLAHVDVSLTSAEIHALPEHDGGAPVRRRDRRILPQAPWLDPREGPVATSLADRGRGPLRVRAAEREQDHDEHHDHHHQPLDSRRRHRGIG